MRLRQESAMDSLLQKAGQWIGVLGLLVMIFSVVMRLGGHYTLGGYSTGALMLAGIGAVCAGCFLHLWVLAERGRPT
jgi:hypothetical protein